MSKNTVDSLKKLYKKLVGQNWPYGPSATDAEVIDKIAEDYTAGSDNDEAESGT